MLALTLLAPAKSFLITAYNRASDDGGGGGVRGPWPFHFFAKYAIPKFVDNRLNSL